MIVSRRKLIRVFQIPGLIVMPLVFGYVATHDLQWLYVGDRSSPVCSRSAQFSFWGNYLPRVYPVHLRGTGESFAANIGGRLIGTSFAWVTATLAVTPIARYAPTKVALVAACVGFSVYLVGLIASAWLPEPGRRSGDCHPRQNSLPSCDPITSARRDRRRGRQRPAGFELLQRGLPVAVSST